MDIGWQEIVVVLVVAMVAFGFGTGRVPQVAKSLGQSVGAFKREATGTLDGNPTVASVDGSPRPSPTRADDI